MAHRLIAFLMVALEGLLVGQVMFMFEPITAGLVVIAFAGMWGRVQVRVNRPGLLVGALVLALVMVLATQVVSMGRLLPIVPLMGPGAHVLARFVLAAQAAEFFVRRADKRLPVYFPVYGAGVATYAGAMTSGGIPGALHHAGVLSYVLLVALFWMSRSPAPRSHWRDHGAHAVILVATLLVAAATSTLLMRYRTQLDQAFLKLVPNVVTGLSKTGLSSEARLDSVTALRRQNVNQVALRVRSEGAPGYLRGKAYDHYQAGRWTDTPSSIPLRSIAAPPSLPAAEPGQPVFLLSHVAQGPWRRLGVSPAVAAGERLFGPLGTGAVEAPTDEITVDDSGNLLCPGLPADGAYTVFAPETEPPSALAPALRERFTSVPADLDPRIRDLAAEIFRAAKTPAAKLHAVIRYFHEHYTYQYGIEVPPGQDPLAYFLLEQPPAHCEYFATGTAVLLRLAGVPARYVTGFITEEYNPLGDYWLARNRDAHAWVEAYDDDLRRWVTVEPTVPDGLPAIPGGGLGALAAQGADVVRFAIQRIRSIVVAGDWRAALRAAGRLLRRPAIAGVCAAVVALLAASKWRRRGALRPTPARDPRLDAMGRLLRRADRAARRRGFVREPDETLHRFAQRIQTVPTRTSEDDLDRMADWYRDYAVLRFRGPITGEAMDELARRLAQ